MRGRHIRARTRSTAQLRQLRLLSQARASLYFRPTLPRSRIRRHRARCEGLSPLPAGPDFIRQSPQDRMARPDTADRLGAQRFQHAPYRIPMPRHQRLAEHQPAPRITPVVYFARGYRRRVGSGEGSSHLALHGQGLAWVADDANYDGAAISCSRAGPLPRGGQWYAKLVSNVLARPAIRAHANAALAWVSATGR
jgi:hypothetical protein